MIPPSTLDTLEGMRWIFAVALLAGAMVVADYYQSEQAIALKHERAAPPGAVRPSEVIGLFNTNDVAAQERYGRLGDRPIYGVANRVIAFQGQAWVMYRTGYEDTELPAAFLKPDGLEGVTGGTVVTAQCAGAKRRPRGEVVLAGCTLISAR